MSSSALPRTSALPAMSRNTTIVVSVLALHVLVLWAMQMGLLRRVVEAVVPPEMLVEIMAPPAPEQKQQPLPQPKTLIKAPTPKPTVPTPAPTVTQPAPTPLAIAPSANAPAPSEAAPTSVAAAPSSATTGSTANAPPAPPAPPKIEQPSSAADHLNNPAPVYPQRSLQLRETGVVTLRILVGSDGLPKEVILEKSSGFDRLDQAALAAMPKWKFVPGKRDGKPIEMWALQAIPFRLK